MCCIILTETQYILHLKSILKNLPPLRPILLPKHRFAFVWYAHIDIAHLKSLSLSINLFMPNFSTFHYLKIKDRLSLFIQFFPPFFFFFFCTFLLFPWRQFQRQWWERECLFSTRQTWPHKSHASIQIVLYHEVSGMFCSYFILFCTHFPHTSSPLQPLSSEVGREVNPVYPCRLPGGQEPSQR